MSRPTSATLSRVHAEPPEQVDVAIVGCGLGGLSAAGFLARQGLKVACFDPHYVAGGNATRFARGRAHHTYMFDVGVHYIGDCHPKGRMTAVLRALGIEQVFEQLDPDGYDLLHFPGVKFRMPTDLDVFRDRLVEMFPKEARGIDRYVQVVRQVDHIARFMERTEGRMTPSVVLELAQRGHLLPWWQFKTIGQFLDTCTRDPLLRGLIVAQNGDYSLPPGEASLLQAAGLTAHFSHGAYYPRGGGQVLADKMADVVEAHGGVIALRCGVERILVEGGRAVGVRTEPRKGQSYTVRARAVLSNADYKRTLLELVGPEHLPARRIRKVERLRMPRALFMTCLGVKGDLRDLGLGAHNLWAYDSPDLDAEFKRMDEAPEPHIFSSFITSACTKDPTTTDHAPEGEQTVEVMTMVPDDPARWGLKPEDLIGRRYHQNPTYQAHKERIEAELIERFEALLPGVKERVVYRESATPMTETRFTRCSGGSSYGLAGTPDQFAGRRPGPEGPLPGLFFCGSSTRGGNGIVAVTLSGYRAARAVGRALGTPVPPVEGL